MNLNVIFIQLSVIKRIIFTVLVFFTCVFCNAEEVSEFSLIESDYKDKIYAALVKQKAFNMDRTLGNISYVCNLKINKNKFPVIDAVVFYSTGVTLRGARFIAILDSKLKLLHKIPYSDEYPVFCHDNVLFLDIPSYSFDIGGISPQGNAIMLSNNGTAVAVIKVAPEKFPKDIRFQ